MPSKDILEKREKAKEVVDILEEISTLLDTDLSRVQLSMCVSLIENGVNPEALATAIKELRQELGALGQDAQEAQIDSSASES